MPIFVSIHWLSLSVPLILEAIELIMAHCLRHRGIYCSFMYDTDLFLILLTLNLNLKIYEIAYKF